ncbi:unnamed protein product [Allacma fusca]|uniref:Uncharacterized protein n=1 Tax=Allacma fusca TaxID=39272 RepID=A0A8J2L8T7_9HEXA|nr:unnamed protein product [Allacma fusca]
MSPGRTPAGSEIRIQCNDLGTTPGVSLQAKFQFSQHGNLYFWLNNTITCINQYFVHTISKFKIPEIPHETNSNQFEKISTENRSELLCTLEEHC